MVAQVMNPGATDLAIKTAIAKCYSVGLAATIMRAIMCNWMVCLAVFLSTAANDLTGKMLGCYLPISTFVGIGKLFVIFSCTRQDVVLSILDSAVFIDSSYCMLCLYNHRIGAFYCQLVHLALGSDARSSPDALDNHL
jgi:formate/nitrite transporter FocA (FNT family)